MKKTLILFAAFVLSSALMANTLESSFQASNSMPKGLKVVILDALNEEFPCLVPESLQEEVTNYRIDQVDQGIRDVYYKTDFVADARVHESIFRVNITVSSVDYEIHNPRFQRYRVEDIESIESCD